MAWISGAIIGGATLLGSMNSASASKNSAGQIAQGDEMSAAEQLGMYQQTRADLLPYMTSGNAALSNLDKLMGITPTASDVPTNTLGPLQTQIDNAAFPQPSQAGPGRSFSQRIADPGNFFHGGLTGYAPGQPTEHVDPIQRMLESHFGLDGLAKGGRARGSKTYVVGEKGPEILHMAPGASGYVEPNSPKVNALAYGSGTGHRLFGGPVGYTADRYSGPLGPRTGDPIQRTASTPVHQIGFQGQPYRPLGFMPPRYMGGRMGMIQPRAGGGPVGGFDPTAGNNTALPGSGQTPADIMAQAPQYQFTEQQGIQGLDQSAAASGNLLSGGHIKDILNYSQGLASEQYQNIFNNLQAVTSLGESAGAMVGNSGTYAGMGMGQSAMAAGNAIGAGTVGAANAYSSGLGNLGFMYAMNPGMFGGSSTGGGGTAYPPQ